MPSSSATALESPVRELARFFTEETGLLQLPLHEVVSDIKSDPEMYYSDHQSVRHSHGRVALSLRSWVNRCRA
jgi:hypothetical protein